VKAGNYFYAGLPEKYKEPFNIAIAYFPELSNARIKIKLTRINTTLNVRPTLGSIIFNSRNNRKYVIRINSSLRDSIITIEEVPFDALIGLFGHELSHISDYRTRNFWRILGRGLAYLSKRKKEIFEKEIDCLAIHHGLGCPLYQWSFYVLSLSDASSKYKLFKRRIYLEPDEIKRLIDKTQMKYP
jgi:hypothetical protein